ncbi:hypothetical protein N7532_000821 [Penicillium argentinense]|uniref:LysM domain-containing protein n=1 Tax=Penicillium argentinense TaxID=1131581 RepID=A0A9W9G672_9EURO|nr:uncharacterized protein N7532_000821 [Penicillium argentinense]KAJ5112776.1 hypothetical protein N7532_000821 [Penicillium argentinense]
MKIADSILAALLSLGTLGAASSSCDTSKLNTTAYLYPITKEGTTVFDVARATKRGVCDIGRHNIMADVTITPNVGQELIIPPQTCTPDNHSCLIKDEGRTRDCIYGGPRLYYTVNGDTYERIAIRLNITTESLSGGESANTTLPVGKFIKVPQCSPSQCIIQPYSFEWGVYKDLAEKFDTTVGQIMMLGPTYNYSTTAFSKDSTYPSIDLAINCTLLSNNVTVLS